MYGLDTRVMSSATYVDPLGNVRYYIPSSITTGKEAYAASLHIMFNHVAQFHIHVVECISKKYNIPTEEIMKTITENDEYRHMDVSHIQSLGYYPQPPVQHVTAAATASEIKIKKPKKITIINKPT